VCPRSDGELGEAIQNSMVFSTPLKHEKNKNLHLYNAKCDGECKTQPIARLPVLRSAFMSRCVKTTLIARSGGCAPEEAEIQDGSLYFFLDAFKPDNANVFVNTFAMDDRRLQKSSQKVFLTYDETSLLKRKSRIDTRGKVNVVEIMTIVALPDWSLAPRKRLVQEGSSNQMNHIGPLVTVDPKNQELDWHLTVAEKREFLVGDTRKDGGGPLNGGETAVKDIGSMVSKLGIVT